MTIEPERKSDESSSDDQPFSSDKRQTFYALSKVVLANWPPTVIKLLLLVTAVAVLVLLGLWLLPLDLRAGTIFINHRPRQ